MSTRARQLIRKIALRILLVAGGLVVACLIGDAIVYARFKRTLAVFPRYVTNAAYGDYRIRGNVPNARYHHKSLDGKWEFRINGQGFRGDRDFEYAKPKDVVRILVLGDSFTIGFEVQQDETYSAVLDKYLNSKGMRAEVINAGVSGFGNAEELAFLEQEGMKFNPDFVVLGFYENDITDNVRSDLFRLDNDGQLTVHSKTYLPAIKTRNFLNSFALYRWLSENSYLHAYLNNAATMYVKTRVLEENQTKVVQEPGKDAESYEKKMAMALLRRIHECASAGNAKFILLDVARQTDKGLSRSLPFDDSTIAGLCDRFVDSTELLKQQEGKAELYQPHGQGHWTPFSHFLVGGKLGETIEALRRQ
jgi:hypothetical protein